MGDDEFLKELKAVAQEETDLQTLPGQDLLDQLPGPVTCRGHDLECQAFACGVTPDASPL